jgi:transcriptional regulator with XRE-family HTH domain
MSLAGEVGERIQRLREEADISQQQLGAAVGLSRSAVSQVELGNRSVKVDELEDFAGALNVSVEELLGKKDVREVVLPPKQEKIKQPAEPFERISVPQKNLEKFEEVLLYVLNKVGAKANVGQTALYKLLYFIDFDYYEKYEQQLIGATYIKNDHGPTPREFIKIIKRMEEEGKVVEVKSEYFDYQQTKYLPAQESRLDHLSAKELEMIDEVLNRLSDMNASQLSEYSHKDVPWMTAEMGEDIDYNAAFYRTAEYSVRDPDREVTV